MSHYILKILNGNNESERKVSGKNSAALFYVSRLKQEKGNPAIVLKDNCYQNREVHKN